MRLATKARGNVWNLRFEKTKTKRYLSKATYPGSVKASLLGGRYEEGGNMDVTHDENHRGFGGVENSLCASQETCCYLEPLSKVEC